MLKLAEENEKLREARERTPSPVNSDECLSRQGLAEMVNAWIWDHHDKKVAEVSANYIGKLERGTIRWPGKLYREAFRAIFSVPRDSALGFINPRRAAVKLVDVKRRRFFQTVKFGAGVLILDGPFAELLESLLEGSEPPPVPRRVGATEIEQVHAATREFKSWDRLYGGGLVRTVAIGQLRWSAGLLDGICPDRLRPELFSAVGYLAETAGYTAQDADAHEEARRVFRFALACAEEAEDWPLRAFVLSGMAQHAVWTGQPDEGLTLAEQALVRPDRLTATGRALLHTDRGHALAKMHRITETLAAVGTADEHFAHASPANDPPCMAFYDEARHALLTGRPLVDLTLLVGRGPGEATSRLEAATGHPAGMARARAICLAKLAILTMVTGHPLQAAAIGHQALDLAGALRSRRAAEELRELSRYSTAHQRLAEAAHLRHRIGTLLRNLP